MTTLLERVAADGFEGLEPVLFYRPKGPNGQGSNFSYHRVVLPCPFTHRPFEYRTGEHRFQACKATSKPVHDAIARQPTPYMAKEAGGPRSRVPGHVLRDCWGDDYGYLCWYVMAELVLAKAIQNPDVARWLRGTGRRPIYEDSPTDDIWGVRYRSSYTGKNLLGRAWMTAREAVL